MKGWHRASGHASDFLSPVRLDLDIGRPRCCAYSSYVLQSRRQTPGVKRVRACNKESFDDEGEIVDERAGGHRDFVDHNGERLNALRRRRPGAPGRGSTP